MLGVFSRFVKQICLTKMDIIRITRANREALEDTPGIQYCGRYPYNVGLGNPWGYKQKNIYAVYICETLAEATRQYDEWLTKLISQWIGNGKIPISTDLAYCQRVVDLARKIRLGEIVALTSYELHATHYVPVKAGTEYCHEQVLYRECKRLIEHDQRELEKLNRSIEKRKLQAGKVQIV